MSTEPNEEETAEEIAARLVVERQWPAIVTLLHPVDFAGKSIASLEFRRGRMGDLKGLTPGGTPTFDQLIMVASRMSGQPVKVIESLSSEDIAEVVQIALGFFMRSLGAGKRH